MAKLTEQELNALRAKHGRIKRLTFNGMEIVFRAPTRPECITHMQMSQGPDRHMADEHLAQLIVVHPSAEAFNALVEQYPYMCHSNEIVYAIGQLSGIVQDEEAKGSGIASSGNSNSVRTSPPASSTGLPVSQA